MKNDSIDTERAGNTSSRTPGLAYVLPHCICLAALAGIGFGIERIGVSGMTALRVVVAASLLLVAVFSSTRNCSVPRWILCVFAIIFFFPLDPPINRSGWRALAWLAGFVVVSDGYKKIESTLGDSMLRTAARWIFDAALWVLVLAVFAMLRCGNVAGSVSK
jgi:hypothetical protein